MKEFFIAVKLDRRDDKDKILADYLNTIYFGRGAYGIQTAAQTYFGKAAKNLTVEEGAVLASVIRSPANYDPVEDAERLQGRFDYVLDGMVANGWLEAGERDGMQVPELAEPKKPKRRHRLLPDGHRAPRAEGERVHRPGHRPRRPAGDLDLRPALAAGGGARGAPGAAAGERPQRAHRPLGGAARAPAPWSRCTAAREAGQLNEATQARVQPGSAFKAFTLSAALRDGISLKSRFWGNSPFDVPGTDKEVNNEFDRDYGSSVDLVTATEESINTAFVDLSLEMGARKVVEAAVDAGIPEDTPGLTANAVIHARHGLGAQHRHGHGLRDVRRPGRGARSGTSWQKVKGANGGTRYQANAQDLPGLRRGRDGRRHLRAAAGREERHRRRGAVARPAGGRQDRHRRTATGHHDVGMVRRLHPAARRRRSTSTRAPARPTSTVSAACRRSSVASTRRGSGRPS